MSADDLMARVNEARDRLREAREKALAATGAIKGIVVSSLILEREARKVTFELKGNYKSVSSRNKKDFIEHVIKTIKADPSHPLGALLDKNGDKLIGTKIASKPVGLQAGHTISRHGLIKALDGRLETFALEEAIPNNYDSRAERQGKVFNKTVLDIGGVPVELTTARILAGLDSAGVNLVNSNIIANAPEGPGWTAPNSLFNESIPGTAGSSQLRGILRGGSKALGPLGLAVDAYSLGDAIAEDGGTFGENTKTTVGGIAGGWGGAAAGAALGTVLIPVPVVGTVVGGIIGGIGGGIAGEWLGDLL